MTESILGCVKIPSTYKISLKTLLFNLRQILRTRAKSNHIICQNFTRITYSLVANIVPFCDLLSWASVAHFALTTIVFQAPFKDAPTYSTEPLS